jgi:hypothetical protein
VYFGLLFSRQLARRPAPAQAPPVAPAAAPPALEITLEQQIGGQAQPVAPKHVFDSGDIIRIRVTSDYDGYLYVMDQGTSGQLRHGLS